MRRSRGRRLLAIAIVLASASGALALQQWPSPTAMSNPQIPQGSAGHVVFALRNDGGSSVDVTFSSGTGSDCSPLTGPVALDGTSSPWTIGVGAVRQFVVTTSSYATTGTKSCMFTPIANPPAVTPAVQVQFNVMSTATLDAQPTSIDFGTQPELNSEYQKLAVTSWSAITAEVEITSDSLNHFELSGSGCGSSTLCSIALPGGGAYETVDVHCNAVGSGSGSGTISVSSSGTTYATVSLHCAGMGSGMLTLSPSSLSMSAMMGSTTMDSIMVSGGTFSMLDLGGGNGTLGIVQCGGAPSCMYTGSDGESIDITCTPSTGTQTGFLVVSGDDGSGSASVSCTLDGGGGSGILLVDKDTVAFEPTVVFGEGSDSITLSNVGSADVTNVVLSLVGTDASHFAFSGCDASSPCTVTNTAPVVVDVYFRPQVHDERLASLHITADNGGSGSGSGSGSGYEFFDSVELGGTGLGGVQVVTSPASPGYQLDLGTLPLAQTGSATLAIRNDGNLAISAMISGASEPYTVSPQSGVIEPGAGSASTFDVTCGSDTPGTYDQTWTVSSDAYIGTPTDIFVKCSVANTNVMVAPLAFDFGEVRVGAAAPSETLAVTNPGPGSAQITSMRLALGRPGLSLTPPNTMTTLAAGTSAMATLRLDTGSDTDLTGELVEIEVGSATLELPVRGKVVTPRSRVAPEELDLGTACVGSQVSGTVRLINVGTATLSVDRPELDAGAMFLAETPGRAEFPTALPPAMDITAQVTPTVSATGTLTSTLTWTDDVPSSYSVPIKLEYVTSGTALSPRGLDFGSVAVDAMTSPQRINLENCDPADTSITVRSLRGIKGPIGAWRIDPQVGFKKTLSSRETLALLVTFRPPARGHYEAMLTVETQSGQQTILLVGDATGRDFDNTSFYSCACASPGAPWGGWPLALAIVAISARRRRGSSSAR